MKSIKNLQWEHSATVDQIKSGKSSDFNNLADLYRQKLLQLANSLLDSNSDAEEVVQDATLRAYHNLPNFRCESHIYTWLYRIVINQARNRRKQLKKMQPLQQLPEYHLQAPDSHLPHNRIYQQEFRQTMLKIIAQLPQSMQVVARLRFVEQYSYEKIARTLHCAPGTVKSRLSRARQLIKYLIIKHQDDLF